FGYAAAAHGQTLERASVLCRELHKQESLPHVLMGLYTHCFGRGAIKQAQSTAEELLQVAQQTQDPMALEEAYHAMGSHRFALGDFQTAHDYFQQGVAIYDPQRHEQHTAGFGFNLGCFTQAFDAHALWMLGAEEDALQQLTASVDHARALSHPYTLALVLAYGAMLHQFCGRPNAVAALATEALAICRKHGIAYYEVWCTMLHTWAVAMQEESDEKLDFLRETIARFRKTESGIRLPYYLYLLADLYLQQGLCEPALATLAEAAAVAAGHGEVWWLTNIHRLQDEISCIDKGAGDDKRVTPIRRRGEIGAVLAAN
ncbi:MAG: hypothetical protein KDE19_19935, partial [Caldilineaceae bacterium]|nr:hypothetical protein [Caldilineaceae bacterium]